MKLQIHISWNTGYLFPYWKKCTGLLGSRLFFFYLYILFLILVTSHQGDWLQITSHFEEFDYSFSLGFYFWCVANQIVVGGTYNEATEGWETERGICIRVKIQINIWHNGGREKRKKKHWSLEKFGKSVSSLSPHSVLYFTTYFVFCLFSFTLQASKILSVHLKSVYLI